ncbi:anthranilate synthase component I family protein [Marinilabilia sp.]|uniref:chorismate-binding protein n=1 Tax=Marinilabilia sp. TaxID=2021252 RepID=UPI0025C2842F|nr:anthranilate synthase component I family protein [Marinilabilia sp.]
MRKWFSFSPGEYSVRFEKRLYQLVSDYEHVAVLTDKYPFYNGHAHQYHEFELLAGFGALNVFDEDISGLSASAASLDDWLLGYFSYDLKNDFESFLSSGNQDSVGFKKFSFFQPRFLIRKINDTWSVGYQTNCDTYKDAEMFVEKIRQKEMPENPELPEVNFQSNVSESEYLRTVEKLIWHIRKGDVYEINYCIDFFAKHIGLDPALVFSDLLEVAPMPFAVLLRHQDAFLMGASPERYLRKRGARLISQPMKGTARRNSDIYDDYQVMKSLADSDKERAENIMIADLVRNDLSRVAARGTVKVEDLCSVFPFPGVYQMISTISAQIHTDANWLDPVRCSFPMGSMTGAPKIRAMELIEKYEKSSRSLYSGAVGYVTPELDYDFNVVIRSFLFNQNSGHLSYTVGSAITDVCNPHEEYEECLLKAERLRKLFNKNVEYDSFRS